MQITIGYYDLIEAIQNYFENKNINIDLDSDCTDMEITMHEADRQPKKHKNGRIVKNEYGYPVYETVGTKETGHMINDMDEITLYLSN
jgi:hypothetical protein